MLNVEYLRSLVRIVTALGLLVGSIGSDAVAAVFCVNSSPGLQIAMGTAAGNTESDEIRIVAGIYPVPIAPTSGFRFVSSQAGDISISGGWGPPPPVGVAPTCSVRIDDPTLTVINGQQQVEGMVIQPGASSGTVKVENLMIRGGSSIGNGGGLFVAPFDPTWPGSLSISTVVFRENEAQNQGGGLYASVPNGRARIENSVFTLNSSGGTAGGADILANGTQGLVANNTVADSISGAGGAGLRVGGNAPILIMNNALFDNAVADLQLSGTAVELSNNFFNLRNGFQPLLETGTISGAPGVGGGTFGLAPLSGSPLIDHGAPVPGGLPARDADGNQRMVGPTVDAGAYEAQIFADGIEGETWSAAR